MTPSSPSPRQPPPSSLPTSKPNYKEYLKNAIGVMARTKSNKTMTTKSSAAMMNSRMKEAVEEKDQDGTCIPKHNNEVNVNVNVNDNTTTTIASPEACILSSVHDSSSLLSTVSQESEAESQEQDTQQDEDGEDSLLSVSPSMLDSSLFEVTTTTASIILSSSEEEDEEGEHQHQNQQIIDTTNDDIIDGIDDDNNDESCWYDRSTFESIGSRMFADDDFVIDGDTRSREDGDGGGRGSSSPKNKLLKAQHTTTTATELKKKENREEKTRATTTDTTATDTGMGSALQMGTIIAGVFGIILIVATSVFSNNSGDGADTGDGSKQQQQTQRNKKNHP
jgi:hypothetical protein